MAYGEPPKPVYGPWESQSQAADEAAKKASAVAEISPAVPASNEHDETAAKSRDEQGDKPPFPVWGDGAAQWVMAILTIVGTFISAWAVWLVRASLDLNRSAIAKAHEANELTKLEQRAWMAADKVTHRDFMFVEMQGGAGVSAEVKIDTKNYRHSVATEVFVDVEMILASENVLPPHELIKFCARWDTDRNASGQILFPSGNPP